MKAKLGLLFLILGFGGTVETAWHVRSRYGVGPWDWRVLSGNRFSGPSFSFEETETHAVPAGTAVEIENRFGVVRAIAGPPGEVRIELRKTVFRSTHQDAAAFASNIRLAHVIEGGVLKIRTNRGELETSHQGRHVGFETHLEVTLPPATRLRVQNEHGATDVTDVAEARVWSSYDNVRVDRVAGPVEVESRHGDVSVSAVSGRVDLSSRHGNVDVRDVTEAVKMSVEHGGVSVARIGPLEARLRHGDVTADDVRGDLQLDGEHAGLTASGVTGRVVVETSYRDVSVQRVGGDARLVSRHGEVRATDVTGAVYAEATYEDVVLARITGPVDVRVSHGGVQAEALAGSAQIRSAGDDVTLDGFRGDLDIHAERGSVRLSPRGPVDHQLQVRALHGGIDLAVPVESRFTLDATSRNGEVGVEGLTGFSATHTARARVLGTVGGGGSAVTLSANGDVRLVPAGAAAAVERGASGDEDEAPDPDPR